MKRISAAEQTREQLRALIEGRLGTAPDRSSLVLAPPVTCRVCPSAFWRRSAGWTTSGRCSDDEFFRPSYSSQAHALIQSQRVHPAQSAHRP